ncbi:MAG: hypothetical protein ACOX6P_10500 [Candidatus Merdivicinus sp.]|jgi:hypothetical protein
MEKNGCDIENAKKPDGLPYNETEIPEGYDPESVNVEIKQVVLKKFPKSETDRWLEELEAQMAILTEME